MGVGFFLRLRAEFFFATALRRRFGGAATALRRLRTGFATALRRLRRGLGRVRALCFGALRLARNAAFWRFVPKCLICFALILRRAFATRLPPRRLAGF